MQVIKNCFFIFNPQNIERYCHNAYHSSRIAKVKALAYGLMGCAVLKGLKMTLDARMYPKGWNLSEEEKKALNIRNFKILKTHIDGLKNGIELLYDYHVESILNNRHMFKNAPLLQPLRFRNDNRFR